MYEFETIVKVTNIEKKIYILYSFQMYQNILVLQSCTTTPLYEISLEIIENNLLKNNKVTVLQCHGQLPTCLYSFEKKEEKCKECIKKQKRGLKLLSGKVNIEKLSVINMEEIPGGVPLTLNNLLDYNENNIQIGKAFAAFYTCSNFYTYKNNLNKEILQNIYRNYKIWSHSFLRIINNYDIVYAHNGRFPIDKFVFNYCKKNNKIVYFYDTADVKDRYVLSKNAPIHNIDYKKKSMKQLWEDGDINKYDVAKKFFELRRNHVSYGSYSFTKNQSKGSLPSQLSESKEIISFFNSTAEEVFTVEGFEYKLFKNELDVLETILTHYKDDDSKQFVLRVHPHLSNCDNYQTEYLYKLPIKFNNLLLIKPEEKIDTYELMDKSSKIIVLNSTMGVESAYWNKPVILLGHACYEDLGCTYQPNNKTELWKLIDQKDLPSLKNDNILQYGYWDLNYGKIFKHCTPISIGELYFKNKDIVIKKKQWTIKLLLKKILPKFLISIIKKMFSYKNESGS